MAKRDASPRRGSFGTPQLAALQENELFKYTGKLTGEQLPPTREMVQSYASNIAQKPVSDVWVSCFVHCNNDQLTSPWSTFMDRDRHNADSGKKYTHHLKLLREKIDFYNVLPEDIYNMDEKGFMIGAVGRMKRIFSKRLFKRMQF
jgi:hypothetical protein